MRPTWGEGSTIAFGGIPGSGLSEYSPSVGEPRQLTVPDAAVGEFMHGMPHFLPGGERLLFTVFGEKNNSIWLFDRSTGERRKLTDGNHPWYVSTGHIVVEREGSLFAAPFDVDKAEILWPGTPLPEKPLVSSSDFAQFAISRNGTFVYYPHGILETQELVWMDRQGTTESIGIRGDFSSPRVSPDGMRIAVDMTVAEGPNAGTNIWIYDLIRGTFMPLTSEWGEGPVWTPDGRRVAYSARADQGIQLMPWDGSGNAEEVAPGCSRLPTSFSPDGKHLALMLYDADTGGGDIALLSLDGTSEPMSFLNGPHHEKEGFFSPDGKWLAFTSSKSGREEVVLTPYPGPGGAMQVSIHGGEDPRWNPQGGELLFEDGAEKLMSVAIATEPKLKVGRPVALFDLEGAIFRDVAPDGERFLVIRHTESSTRINVVLNWFEELERLVPRGN